MAFSEKGKGETRRLRLPDRTKYLNLSIDESVVGVTVPLSTGTGS